MKKILTFTLAIFLSLQIFAQTATPPAAGDGSESNPLQIATLENLYWISQNSTFWNVYYIQVADIDATETATWFGGQGFTPIGGYLSNEFTGSYNGDGYIISNLTINREQDGAALFSAISSTAEIKNLGITNVYINLSQNDVFWDTGALIGWSKGGNISNCYSTGIVNGDCTVGGLVGSFGDNATITNCYSTCTVTGNNTIGGLMGWLWGDAENCYATGNASGDNTVGGFIGYLGAGSINSCYSTGNTAANSWAAGFAGASDGNITNCYSLGNVTRYSGSTETDFAGFATYSGNDKFIEYCYSTGSITYEDATNPSDKGFISSIGTNTTFTANYFDYTTSGQTSGIGATPKLTSQMQTASTFTDTGWDFACETTNGTNDYWGINGADNSGYPFLLFQGYAYENESPVITSTHNNQTLGDGSTCSEILPDYTGTVIATDNCDANLDVTQSPTAGTTISGATNTVTLTVTDDAGNYAEVSFNVAILDNTNPVITSTHNDVQIDADANCEASLPDYTTTLTATDNCDVNLDVTQSPTAGTTISGATNTVTLTVTDDSGNFAEVSFNVEVADNTNPTITCVGNQTVTADNTHHYTVSGIQFDPTATDDNCGVASVINNINSTSTLAGEQLSEGTTTIVWTVTDNAGNTATCSFDVLVNTYVGIADLSANGISVYPNPTSGIINLTGFNEPVSVKNIEITDITGKTILSFSNFQINQFSNYEIDLSDFESGIYMLKISTDTNIYTQKIIKK